MNVSNPRQPWAFGAGIGVAILAVIGSAAGSGGTGIGFIIALIMNPFCWLSIWLFYRASRTSDSSGVTVVPESERVTLSSPNPSSASESATQLPDSDGELNSRTTGDQERIDTQSVKDVEVPMAEEVTNEPYCQEAR